MKLLRALPALLVFCSCSGPTRPLIPDQTRLLRPAVFQHLKERNFWWTLYSGNPNPKRSDHEIGGTLAMTIGPETLQEGKWFTLSMEQTPRFVFQERKDSIRIYRNSEVGFLEFARLMLPLQAGRSWASYRREFDGTLHVIEETATCRAEVLRGDVDTHDALRVDFSEGEIRHTMWFSPGEGLVQWDGIESGSVVRQTFPIVHQLLAVAATTYAEYPKTQFNPQWAHAWCGNPPPPPGPESSASDDFYTHGRKLYYVFARDFRAYFHAKTHDQPDGQIVVKESWYPGEKLTKGPLFMMMKHEGEWVYATASADGQRVTQQGRLKSCIDCHESDGNRDGLFGPKTTPYSD